MERDQLAPLHAINSKPDPGDDLYQSRIFGTGRNSRLSGRILPIGTSIAGSLQNRRRHVGVGMR